MIATANMRFISDATSVPSSSRSPGCEGCESASGCEGGCEGCKAAEAGAPTRGRDHQRHCRHGSRNLDAWMNVTFIVLRGTMPSSVRNWGVNHTDLQWGVKQIEKALKPVGRVSAGIPESGRFTLNPPDS